MASAAEQLAQNMNFSSFAKAKELQQRILFTIGILIVYRIGTFVPIPGIDPVQYALVFEQNSQGILRMFNMLGGGAVERMAIFALNVMPYISASIIMQLMTATIPSLEKLKKEGGEAGRKQINQYSRYLTVVLATGQALAIAIGMSTPNADGATLALNPGTFFIVSTVVTLVGGTMLLMWLGEQITARGVGNGISLIIFAGIIAAVPSMLGGALAASASGAMPAYVLFGGLALILAGLILVVFVERSQRRLLVQYPKRQQGNKMVGGDTSFLPLKLNTAGVIPPIFASSLLLLPATAAGFQAQASQGGFLATLVAYLGPGQPIFMATYAAMIIFFCFFYTSIVFNPDDVSENLRKYGGFLPGIRPGKRTAEYLDFVLSRLTLIGALYLTLICMVPMFIDPNTALGGTSILIVVSVTMDTISQIQSHMFAHQYESVIKKSQLRGRKR